VNAYLSEERSAQTVKDVAINGFVVMQLLDLKPGPIVGQILSYLFDKVTSQEIPNEPETLERHILEHRLTLLNLDDM
jgi:tRNA nucleotidyltransferase/poly(A) polymerase